MQISVHMDQSVIGVYTYMEIFANGNVAKTFD